MINNRKYFFVIGILIFAKILLCDSLKIEAAAVNWNESDTEINFEWEDARNRQGSYSVLTDRHGISVFSQEFAELVETYQQVKEDERDVLFYQIISQKQVENSFEDIFYLILNDEARSLTQENQVNNYEERDKEDYLVIMGVILGMLFSFVIMFEIRRRMDKKEAKNEDNFDSYNLQI